MLKRLHLQNFTVFADADFEFSPGLNVLVGTNGTGKSHVLKVGYAVSSTVWQGLRGDAMLGRNSLMEINQQQFLSILFPVLTKLVGVFQPVPSQAKELIRRSEVEATAIINSEISYSGGDTKSVVTIAPSHPKSRAIVSSGEIKASANLNEAPVFIPAKEVLTTSWMRPAAKQLELPLDETYLDLLEQLDRLPLKNPPMSEVLSHLAREIGGEVEAEGSRFYLSSTEQRPMDINLVAEGLRKFGTLQRLLINGSLTAQSTLFWDEPEANLNPALLRQLAAILAELARQGFQIILATHSMSLLKEFHILSREKEKGDLPIRYFGLNARPGHATTVVAQDDFEYLPDVVALDVELQQADKLEEIFAREDRETHANNH